MKTQIAKGIEIVTSDFRLGINFSKDVLCKLNLPEGILKVGASLDYSHISFSGKYAHYICLWLVINDIYSKDISDLLNRNYVEILGDIKFDPDFSIYQEMLLSKKLNIEAMEKLTFNIIKMHHNIIECVKTTDTGLIEVTVASGKSYFVKENRWNKDDDIKILNASDILHENTNIPLIEDGINFKW